MTWTRSTARKEALAVGAKTYHGRPCKYGHTLRRTANKACVECDRDQKRAEAASGYSQLYHQWWKRVKDPNRERQRRWEAAYRFRSTLKRARQDLDRTATRRYTLQILYGGNV